MFFYFNDTATTEIYTLSLHDALPILQLIRCESRADNAVAIAFYVDQGWRRTDTVRGYYEGRVDAARFEKRLRQDRKSTRLNSSHLVISYAVFCLKNKTKAMEQTMRRR